MSAASPPADLVRWRISVGKRHRVEPRQIVGALANEGGLKRADFGRIDIKPNFSLVELPPDLSPRDARQARRHPHLRDPDRPAARQGPGPRSGPPKRFNDGGPVAPSRQEAAAQEALTPTQSTAAMNIREPGGAICP